MVLIIYDSVYGNTERIAITLAAEIESQGTPSIARPVKLVTDAEISTADLLVFGSPTRGFVPTEAMKLFLSENALQLSGRRVSAFDTRLDPKATQAKIMGWFVKEPGYANDYFGKEFHRIQAHVVVAPQAFYVRKGKGPMTKETPDEIVRFATALVSVQLDN
jgi:flavodoxin